MANQKELAEKINLLTAQVNKIGAESTKSLELIAELKTALENQENVSPELQTAFDNLQAQIKIVDELVPDAPVVEEPVVDTAVVEETTGEQTEDAPAE